jgi:uncharacterized glyoxalase superfamily protein PhnB
MKRSMTLTLGDQELMELQRIILDGDKAEALRFLERHFKDKVRAVLEGEGHCKPFFEITGRSAIPSEFDKSED